VIRRLIPTDLLLAPLITGINGAVDFTPSFDGLYLYSTLIEAPQPFAMPISVSAKGAQISIYSDESLVKRGVDRVQTTVNLSQGITPLNVVIVGASTKTTITIPADIRAFFQQFIPPVPEWRSPIAIETNYVDPKTGGTGNGLFWKNSAKAGGWGVYRVNQTSYGMIIGAELIANRHYFLTVDGFHYPPINSLIASDTNILGYLTEYVIDSGNAETIFKVQPTSYFDPILDVLSGTLYTNGFNHISDVVKSTGESFITFTDTNVQAGTVYSYTIDAYAPFDTSLRGEKAEIKSVEAGDTTPPGSINLISFVVDSNVAYAMFHTPTDLDYLGVKVYYDNVSSGTYDNVFTDMGLPDLNDQLSFTIANQGTYLFQTFDIVGNEQDINSGVAFGWGGEQIGGSNIPPTVSIRMLSSAEVVTDGYDPLLVCRFEFDAVDPEGETPTVEYRTRDQAPGVWVGAGALPAKTNVSRTDRDNWIQARAYDGLLYSDVMTVIADYDTRPEIVAVNGRVDLSTNTVEAYGTVDDDTNSIRWQVRDVEWDGALLDSGVVADTSSTKTFTISFSIDDGSRRVLRLWPYSGVDLSGYSSVGQDIPFEIAPRTRISVTERGAGGAVKRNEVAISISSEPAGADIYVRFDPVAYGTADGYSSTTISDSTQGGVWSDDQFNTGYEVYLDGGLGAGQVRDITDTVGSSGELTIDPAWTTTPDGTTTYRVRENYQPYTAARSLVRNSSRDIRVDYYSEIEIDPGVFLTETPQGIIIDYDTIPEIASGTAVETDAKVISFTILDVDEDAKVWELYARKGGWPTKTGSKFGEVSIDYIRVKKPTEDASVTFAVENGEWNFILRPLDSYSNYGPKTYYTVPISDVSNPGNPAITSASVEPHDENPTNEYNRVSWTHNNDAEKPGGGDGLVTVKIFAYRSDNGVDSEEEITTPATRYVWQDSEDGVSSYTNGNSTDESGNSISNYGSLVHFLDRRAGPPAGSWMTWYYRVELYDNGTFVSSHETELSDWYGPLI